MLTPKVELGAGYLSLGHAEQERADCEHDNHGPNVVSEESVAARDLVFVKG